ncbi:hypothetical protein NB636_04510 [Oxalobacter aliiformigenes]|uniref:hypothetical protein n=1 Tax=Oxalobacter aliiformigenes TaxID=2946593 RepID=UPI0022AEFD9E|nr:hypothetical protein [Oxalobacter aliiformigenes]MCZ4064991.1 hypothetical protein [Oxalobacter aliiformigenes]WAW00110.1 hypothetical protein NB636_04510 [Oxalobacter aliiformigenes]
MSDRKYPKQERNEKEAVFDWIWKSDDAFYESDRLKRYRRSAGKKERDGFFGPVKPNGWKR